MNFRLPFPFPRIDRQIDKPNRKDTPELKLNSNQNRITGGVQANWIWRFQKKKPKMEANDRGGMCWSTGRAFRPLGFLFWKKNLLEKEIEESTDCCCSFSVRVKMGCVVMRVDIRLLFCCIWETGDGRYRGRPSALVPAKHACHRPHSVILLFRIRIPGISLPFILFLPFSMASFKNVEFL